MRQIKVKRDYHQTTPPMPAPASRSLPLREGKGGSAFPDNYNGIPYAIIVNALLARFGFAGGIVPEGARNTTLYKLARQLRYICDFNPLLLQLILPSWGLPDEEIRGTVQSAIASTRSQDMPYDLKSVLNTITKPDLSTSAKRHEYLEKLNPLPQQMPWLFNYIYKRYGRNGRSALVASLPMLGTLLGRFGSKCLDCSDCLALGFYFALELIKDSG